MKERSSIMGRMFLLLGLLLLLPAGILLQMLRVNLVEGDGFRELWSSQAIDYISIPAERGYIYDTNGSILAANTVIYQVAIDPHSIDDPSQIENIASTLSSHTGRTAQYYRNRIRQASTQSKYVVLERSVPVQTYEDLNELNIRGLILEEQYRRNYSFGSLSAHLLGFVNHNLTGMEGLEARYNDLLKGNDGLQQVRKDRLNQVFAYVGAPRKLPKQGHSLHTTINAQIQAIVEEELEVGIQNHRAKQGTAIVMNPKTGAIKALANYPTFNPNSPASVQNENRRNFAVSDMIEPGSTFKLATAIAAVEQNAVRFDEIFETPENGSRMIHGQAMRDHIPLGDLYFSDVIARSSNIATSEIAMRLEPDVFYQYARNLGFGTPTRIDLPGERGGRLQRPYEWSRVTLPWMSIGYEVQVTPIQLIQAYAAFANGGAMMKPYVVDRVTDEYGNIKKQKKPQKVRQVAKKQTIERLMPVFEQVVSDSGTASWASIDGLRIAGKTGTAQKYIDGRYQTRYRASFVGFFPVDDPEYVILIILDEPRTSIFGGFTSGSVFKEIATRVSSLGNNIQRTPDSDAIAEERTVVIPRLQGLNSSQASALLKRSGIPFTVEGNGAAVLEQSPAPGEIMSPNTPIRLTLGVDSDDSIPEGYTRIPDLTHFNMRQATHLLMSRGLNIETVGSGTIYTQFPRAGDLMQKGRIVTVRGKARPINQVSSIVTN